VGEKGGAEVVMVNTLRGLNRELFQPAVFLLRPGPLAAELQAMGVTVYQLKAHRMRNLFAVASSVWAIARTVRKERIGLLHSNAFRGHVYGGLAARLARVPEVWTVHTYERVNPLTRLILKIPSNQVIANCPRTSQFYQSAGHPNVIIWPGVDIARLEQGTARPVLAERYGIPATARWVSLAARLQRFKGHHYLLRALAALPQNLRDVQGIIIGGTLFGMEPDYPGELKAEAARLGIAGRVHFTGFINDDDVAGFLAASAVVVHTALDEDFGLTVAEAQALGRPVVAFAAAGPAAIVEQERTGLLVPVGDQAALTAALVKALSDPQTLDAWGCAARARARANFANEAQVKQTEAIYRRCVVRQK
jgi:glycosyltransferase involved in cell wall biosynthesis